MSFLPFKADERFAADSVSDLGNEPWCVPVPCQPAQWGATRAQDFMTYHAMFNIAFV